jgi:hypothetical protein
MFEIPAFFSDGFSSSTTTGRFARVVGVIQAASPGR